MFGYPDGRYVIYCTVKDYDTGKVISRYSRFHGIYGSRDEAETYICGRVNVKNTNTYEAYYINRLDEDDDEEESEGRTVCVWEVCPFHRRSDGIYTIFVHITTEDLEDHIPIP